MAGAELTGLDWLSTVTLSLAALEVDPCKRGKRPGSSCSIESGYTSSSSDSSDEVAEVLRSDAASREAWERAKQGGEQAVPIESVTAVAIALLKSANGCTAERIVDYIRKSIPHYATLTRGSLLDSVHTALQSNRHFQSTEKGGRTLWTCARSKNRKDRRRRSSPTVGKRKRSSTNTGTQGKLKSRSSRAGKNSDTSDTVVIVCNPTEQSSPSSSESAPMVPDESAESLLLAIAGNDTEEVEMPADLFNLQPLDVSAESVSSLDSLSSMCYDIGMDDLNDLACMLDAPSQSWLPTSYVPGSLLSDDGLAIC